MYYLALLNKWYVSHNLKVDLGRMDKATMIKNNDLVRVHRMELNVLVKVEYFLAIINKISKFTL